MNQSSLDAITPNVSDLTVIIVTYNSAHCIMDLGKSLREFPHIVVVDNNSDDDTIFHTTVHLPKALVIQNSMNMGFGAANNKGLINVKTKFCLLLNPDCEINIHSALKMIESALIFPSAAIIAPQLIGKNSKLEINYRWPKTLWSSNGPGADGCCSVGFACGAALLLNMDLMQDIGFFDESFFLYYEDDDLCHRVFNAKKSIIINPEVKLVHSSRGSVRGKNPLKSEYIRGYHHAQSKILYARKYKSLKKSNALRLMTLLGAIFSFPLRVITFSPKLISRQAGRIIGLIRMR
jgi:N-acetylglucosaminyl-diphospho-decaprenol L-rhamnosyltransferase